MQFVQSVFGLCRVNFKIASVFRLSCNSCNFFIRLISTKNTENEFEVENCGLEETINKQKVFLFCILVILHEDRRAERNCQSPLRNAKAHCKIDEAVLSA